MVFAHTALHPWPHGKLSQLPSPLINFVSSFPTRISWPTLIRNPKIAIPPSSGYTAIGLSVAAVVTVVVKHLWIPRKYWDYVPNWNAIGLAFVVPQTYYGTAMAAGATFNYLWERRNPRNFDMYMFPISAGMLAGEGLGGVLLALLSVAGVGADGEKYGTSVGCTSKSSFSGDPSSMDLMLTEFGFFLSLSQRVLRIKYYCLVVLSVRCIIACTPLSVVIMICKDFLIAPGGSLDA
jgi:hypothetical protein